MAAYATVVPLATLRVLGVTRGALSCLLLAEGAVIGTVGAGLGIALGYLAAVQGVRHFGADLGGGYFQSVVQVSSVAPGDLLVFFSLGICAVFPVSLQEFVGKPEVSPVVALITTGILGVIGFFAGFFPARSASRLDPVVAMKM